jgi:hypothetical protein
MQIGKRFIDVSEIAVGGSGNVVAREEILGECLGAFELRGVPSRAKAFQPLLQKGIDDAGHQRGFRANDCEADIPAYCKLDQGGDVGDIDVDILHGGFQRRTRISRSDIDLVCQRGLCCLPGQGMFTAA